MASKKNNRKTAGLNERQEQFVREYLVDLNATQAAERCGYKHPRVQGPRLLAKVAIADAIAAKREKVVTKLDVTLEDIGREMARCGFSNSLDYMRVGENGDPFVDFSKLTREQAAAISEVTVEDFVDGRGEDARDVRRVKFKLVDKRASLMDLAKLLGFVRERHEHSGPDGKPIEVKSGVDLAALSADDRTRLRALLRSATGIAPTTKGYANGHAANGNGANGAH